MRKINNDIRDSLNQHFFTKVVGFNNSTAKDQINLAGSTTSLALDNFLSSVDKSEVLRPGTYNDKKTWMALPQVSGPDPFHNRVKNALQQSQVTNENEKEEQQVAE
jgi:hypothetical protein